MIQSVGAIIRFSIGIQNKFGHRRQRVALSYRDIQRYAKIASPSVLSKTIRGAMAKNYIERVEEGYFDRNGGALSRAAHYAVKWAQPSAAAPTTPKSVAGNIDLADHTENFSGSTPKTVAADRSEKCSDIEIKQRNKTLKQQQNAAVAFERLKAEGFDTATAQAMVSSYPAERIFRQIEWLPKRRVKSNRLGLLRASIEQDWTAPQRKELGAPNTESRTSTTFEQAVAAAHRRLRNQTTS